MVSVRGFGRPPGVQKLIQSCAVGLVDLGVLPFTPPFSTCHISILLASTPIASSVAPASGAAARVGSIAQAGLFFASLFTTVDDDLKNLSLAVSGQPAAGFVPKLEPVLSLASARDAAARAVPSSVLRI